MYLNSCFIVSLSLVWMDHSLQSLHLLRDIRVGSRFGLIRMKLLNIHTLVLLSYREYKFSFIRNHHTLHQSGYAILYQRLSFSTSSPAFRVVTILYFNLSPFLAVALCFYIHDLLYCAAVDVFIGSHIEILLPLCPFISLFILVFNSFSTFI